MSENNNNTKYDWVLLTDPQTIPSGDFIIPKDKKIISLPHIL